jgi:AraC-like DNA-binding protein
MVDGSFDTTILGKRLDCSAGTIWSEPAEERHANDIGSRGARALVVQLDPGRAELVLPFDIVSSDVLHLRHAGIATSARRLLTELDAADDFTQLVAESTVVEMIVTAARLRESERGHHAPPPGWVMRAQEILHERAREGLQLADVAALVGEAPWRVARAFRRHFHTSVGEYARSVRLTWALDQLAATRTPISEIAHAAGYADQSHFTRACTMAIGIGPAEYRRRGSTARWRTVGSARTRAPAPVPKGSPALG